MDVRLSAEQFALKESAHHLLSDLAPKTVADLDDAERVSKLDAAVSAAGWRELRAADDEGGPLASGVEAMLVAEELGRSAADTAFLGPLLATDLCRRAGVVAPEGATVTLTDDLSALAIDIEAPSVVIDAHRSAVAVVAASSLATVDVLRPAVRHDLTRHVAAASTSAGPLTGASPLTDEDRVAWEALALAVVCGDLVGTIRGATELARDYAQVREQFGRPVGSFQAVQHLLADAHVAAEGAHSLALHAAWAADALPPDEALLAARQAKAYCSRAARSACEAAVQVHGGIGNTWECMAHVYLRRALHSSDILGGVGPSLSHVLGHHGIEG